MHYRHNVIFFAFHIEMAIILDDDNDVDDDDELLLGRGKLLQVYSLQVYDRLFGIFPSI